MASARTIAATLTKGVAVVSQLQPLDLSHSSGKVHAAVSQRESSRALQSGAQKRGPAGWPCVTQVSPRRSVPSQASPASAMLLPQAVQLLVSKLVQFVPQASV